MSKIEIHDIKELIESNYPPSIVKKMINEVLILSMQVKTDYPDYRNWFTTIQVPGLYDGTRNIIVAHIKDRIVGFVSLKKTAEEKKICTFYVEKNFRKNKIGTILVEKAIEYLETERPLITIPLNKLHEFTKIGEKLNWEITDIVENLYRTDIPEVIVNGYQTQNSENIILPAYDSIPETVKQYRIHRIKKYINQLKNYIYRLENKN